MMFEHAQFYELIQDDRLLCTLCPRACKLADGQRGLCFVRQRQGKDIVLTTYGRSSGFIIDPIEKKPLNHFLPGTSVLSFGTAGCNLSCKFCQNWDMSKSQEMDILQSPALPHAIAKAALNKGCRSVAFTYNDPVIFYEYAVDTAIACHERGIQTVAVTAGYISDRARSGFFKHIDAANVDLKAFSDRFYHDLCSGTLQPVLKTLEYLVHETNIWTEITTLLIPKENDSFAEIDAMTRWIVDKLGTQVPLHFSAFHPDYKLTLRPATPRHSLIRARDIALKNGIEYVYLGNIYDPESSATYCSHCKEVLISRTSYTLNSWHLDDAGLCEYCQSPLPGIFEEKPGHWGNHCERILI